jgi:anti-anti-sigma factor
MDENGAQTLRHWTLESGDPLSEGAFVCAEGVLGNAVWARIRGALGTGADPRVTRQLLDLLDLPISELHVDLGAVTYIDSAGIGSLIVTRRQAEFRGITMTFERLAPLVRDALSRAGLLSSFIACEDRHRDESQR